MNIKGKQVYPNCPTIHRTLVIGGMTKTQLIQKLQQSTIALNEYAQQLFASDIFATSRTKYTVHTVQLTVRDLGYAKGATTHELFKRASDLGLKLCPLELAVYLRLEYVDQPEYSLNNSSKRHQAPSGSITIASQIETEDDDFPKGFYLRRINDVLWLRGYLADHLHVWNPGDHFIFCQTNFRKT